MAGLLAVILPILVVAGAFMWMQPSKRDQHLAKMRSEALVNGFRIDSLRVPDTSEFGRVNQKHQIVTLYQRSTEIESSSHLDVTIMRTSGEHGAYLPKGWMWDARSGVSESQTQQLAEFVLTLPESVTVLRIARDSIGVSWDEKDPGIDFKQLKEWLGVIAGIFNKVVI